MSWDVVFILFGILLLYFGGEGLVDGSRRAALKMGMTPLVAGLVVAAWATSTPEAAASLWAELARGSANIALANVIGSNIANIGLVLGVAAMVRPIRVDPLVRSRQVPLMLGVSILVIVLMWGQAIWRWEGLLLLILLAGYLWLQVAWGKRHHSRLPLDVREGHNGWGRPLFFLAGGVIALVIGAALLIEGAAGVAHRFGVSERVIGLSMVAIGTSLPELATSVVAAGRGHTDIALGNVVGSNVFNILFVTGLLALLRPLRFAPELLQYDAPVMLVFALVLWAVMIVGLTIRRWQGAVLLLLYLGYLALTFA